MLALRFANGIFEPIWNRQFIDHVQITVAESIGIEGRGGVLRAGGRDPRHLPEPPAPAGRADGDGAADRLHRRLGAQREGEGAALAAHARAEVGRARPVRPRLRRGRGGAGLPRGGGRRRATRRPRRTSPRSSTSTTGAGPTRRSTSARASGSPRRETTIAIQFQRAPHPPFAEIAGEGLRPNVLLIHVQPDEGVSLAIGAKVPGAGMSIRTVHMDFLYGGAFRTGLPEAYERLILDAMLGDATLFTRADEVDEQWALVDAIVAAWKRDRPNFPNYAAGTWGPRVGGRARSTATAGAGGGTDGRRRPGRARAGRAAAATSDDGSAGPAHERDDARGLGAAAVGGRGAQDAGGTRGATPVADDPALPRARAGEPGRRRVSSAVLRHRRVVTRGVLRGDRAAAARGRARVPGSIVAAAADLRSADVLPLARHAAVGRARARAARRTSATGSSSTRRSGAGSRRLSASSRSSSTGSRSRTSPGAVGSAGVGASRRSGRRSADARRCR